MLKQTFFAATALALTVGPLAQAKTGSEIFEDAYTYFGRSSAGYEASMTANDYDVAERSLATQFAAICGDTFCSGDYNNIKPLALDCSVGHDSGTVGDCVWTLGASATAIDEETGVVHISKKMYTCHLGIKGSAAELSGFLRSAAATRPGQSDGLRQVEIPGTGKTLLGVLTECL